MSVRSLLKGVLLRGTILKGSAVHLISISSLTFPAGPAAAVAALSCDGIVGTYSLLAGSSPGVVISGTDVFTSGSTAVGASFTLNLRFVPSNPAAAGFAQLDQTYVIVAINTPPVWVSGNSASVAENSAGTVYTCNASDANGHVLAYSITGGADAARFSLTGTALTFVSPPNFEAPADANGDNAYVVELTASDGLGGSTTQVVTITVVNANEAPTAIGVTWRAGYLSGVIPENTAVDTVVADLSSTDVDAGDTLTYTRVGGDTRLKVVGSTLAIASLVDYEAGVNSPTTTIRSTDAGGSWVERTVSWTITDINEGVVTGLTMYGALSVNITNPATMSIPMNLNGAVLRVATSLSATTISDASKITVRVRDNGFDTSGSPVTRDRTLYVQDQLHRPYNEVTQFSPAAAGVFDLVLSDFVYNQDGTNFTTILGVDFVAGWATGGGTETAVSVARLDSRPYPKPIVRPHFLPYEVVTAAGGNGTTEWAVTHAHAQANQSIARFEVRARVGLTYGPWVGSGSEVRSNETPAAGRNPGGFAAPVFRIAGSVAGLTGPAAAAWEWRAYPWIGPVYDSSALQTPSQLTSGGATVLQANMGASDPGADYNPLQISRGVPFVLDGSTPTYTPCYAWVLYTGAGTATTSANVSTSSADPGTAVGNNFASLATAATAIKSFNNARGHNDLAGGVIMLRDVAGGVEGTATGGYHNATSWSNQTTWAVGIGRIEIRSVGGVPTPNCRVQSAKDDGAGGITIITLANRVVGQRVLWRGITFDGLAGYNQGSVAAQNVVVDGGTGGIPSTRPAESAAISQMFVDCRSVEFATAGSSNAVFRQMGYMYFVRHEWAQIAGSGSVGNHSTFSGAVAIIGSYAAAANVTQAQFNAPLISATYIKGTAGQVSLRGTYNTPTPQNVLLQHSRCDLQSTSVGPLFLTLSDSPINGLGVRCLFGRYVGVTTSATGATIFADNNLFESTNVVLHGAGIDCGDSDSTASAGRFNVGYNEQGWNAVLREMFLSYLAVRGFNIKGSPMNAPETPASGTAATGQYSAGRAYFKNTVVWDTPATANGTSRVYQALQNVPAGTALTNAAYWEDRGLVALSSYGAQPKRTGNEALRYAVGCRGNVACRTASTDTTANANNSWYGIVWSRGGALNQNFGDYYKTRVATGLTLADTVDYRPKRIADGDGVDSPLLNRIPAGMAYAPFDIVGAAIPNDGTGAAGAYQA